MEPTELKWMVRLGALGQTFPIVSQLVKNPPTADTGWIPGWGEDLLEKG